MAQDALAAKAASLVEPFAVKIAARQISPHLVTLAGVMAGLGAMGAAGLHLFWLAIVFIALNRACDGLDGMIARMQGRDSAFGAFLDTLADTFFFSGMIFVIVLGGQQAFAAAALFLLFSWILNAACKAAFEKAAAARLVDEDIAQRKSLLVIDGFPNQLEATAVVTLACILPHYFPVIAIFYGVICLLACGARVLIAIKYLR